MATRSTQPIITVSTAQPLTASQVAQVKKILEERAGQAKIVFSTDPSILGGVKVKIGDQQFDATLEGQLERLQLTRDHCTVTTAVPLTAAQYKKLATAISDKFGSIVIDELVDPSVIGGIKIVVASKEYDHTIKAKLDQLHKQATTNL
jgi:F0F1-type ATP synthase delta subunit